jgi:hypothetical protein
MPKCRASGTFRRHNRSAPPASCETTEKIVASIAVRKFYQADKPITTSPALMGVFFLRLEYFSFKSSTMNSRTITLGLEDG